MCTHDDSWPPRESQCFQDRDWPMSNDVSSQKEDSYSTIVSPGEDVYYAKLQALTEKYPHDMRHYLDLFPVYASRRAIIRLFVFFVLFLLFVDLPGHYADFGIYFGF